MPAYKYQTKDGSKWYIKANYTDATGMPRQHCRRGFKTKREAQEYERTFLLNPNAPTEASRSPQKGAQQEASTNITEITAGLSGAFSGFQSEHIFKDIRMEYIHHAMEKELRADTMETKLNIIDIHIAPFFDEYKLHDTTKDVIRQWQTIMRQKRNRQGKPFSETFLHSVQSQLNAILNYCIKKQYITILPMIDLRNMGRKHADEMHIWSPQQYTDFAKAARDREETFLLFELYFWLGLCRGEALALTPADIMHNPKTTIAELLGIGETCPPIGIDDHWTIALGLSLG